MSYKAFCAVNNKLFCNVMRSSECDLTGSMQNGNWVEMEMKVISLK